MHFYEILPCVLKSPLSPVGSHQHKCGWNVGTHTVDFPHIYTSCWQDRTVDSRKRGNRAWSLTMAGSPPSAMHDRHPDSRSTGCLWFSHFETGTVGKWPLHNQIQKGTCPALRAFCLVTVPHHGPFCALTHLPTAHLHQCSHTSAAVIIGCTTHLIPWSRAASILCVKCGGTWTPPCVL